MRYRFSFEFCVARLILLFIALQFCAFAATAQTAARPSPTPTLEKRFFKNIVRDQARIFTAPFRLRAKDAPLIASFGVGVAGLIATDRQTADKVSGNPVQRRISNTISFSGSGYGTGAVAGGFYLFGRIKKNARARETGLLAGEALIDTTILITVLKAATQRARPLSGGRRTGFFTKGNSFPSGHSAAAWSLATVVAHEYKAKPIIKYGAYGLAAAVSVARFTGRKHFLSDVAVGSAIGYGIGRYVYRARHDSQLDSDPQQKSKDVSQSKLLPLIVPRFNRAAGVYGATLEWNF